MKSAGAGFSQTFSLGPPELILASYPHVLCQLSISSCAVSGGKLGADPGDQVQWRAGKLILGTRSSGGLGS